MTRYWTCRKCRTRHTRTTQKCGCGTKRPPSRRAKHLAALDHDYQAFIELNGGEHCAICGRLPSANRRLDRDHCHDGAGTPRGLLCARCNRALPNWVTAQWLRRAAAYLERERPAPGVQAVTPLDGGTYDVTRPLATRNTDGTWHCPHCDQPCSTMGHECNTKEAA